MTFRIGTIKNAGCIVAMTIVLGYQPLSSSGRPVVQQSLTRSFVSATCDTAFSQRVVKSVPRLPISVLVASASGTTLDWQDQTTLISPPLTTSVLDQAKT